MERTEKCVLFLFDGYATIQLAFSVSLVGKMQAKDGDLGDE